MPKYKLSGYIDEVVSIEVVVADEQAARKALAGWEASLKDSLGVSEFVYCIIETEGGKEVEL